MQIEALESRVLFSTHPNLLVNGNFSLGNVGFTSQYVNKAQAGGGYVVGSNPKINLGVDHDAYFSMGDHTTGKGLMLEADAATKPYSYVWEETVNVVVGQNYAFTGYDASIADANANGVDPSPARLAVYVNGVSTGDVFTAQAKDGQWSRFSTVWADTARNAGTTAVIKIVDLNTAIKGNDFVLDDLSFFHSPNMIVNGNFSAGNTGFTSSYVNEQSHHGGYAVVANPQNLESGFANIGDHTTGTGPMLVADGSISANHSVWQESLSLTAGDSYIFSGWTTSVGQSSGNHIDPSPAKLAIYINGVKQGKPGSSLPISAADGQWSKFSSVWAATSTEVITIKIVDLNTADLGNNFALDDLAFEVL